MIPMPTWQQWLIGTLTLAGLLVFFAIVLPWWRNKRRDFHSQSETFTSVLERALQGDRGKFLQELEFLQIYYPPYNFDLSRLFDSWGWRKMVEFKLAGAILGRLAQETNLHKTLAALIREQFEDDNDGETCIPNELIEAIESYSSELADLLVEEEALA